MAKIPNEVVTKVRESVDIADVIGQYVNLKPAGKNLTGLCPFHQERTPSFSVNEQKQFYYCFGCHRGGNVFRFLMDFKHIDFVTAVNEVAKFGDVQLPSQYSKAKQSNDKPSGPRGQLLKMHSQAADLYHHILVSTVAGQPAMNYLKKRGMSREMIDEFNIGFAPDKEILKPFFASQKIDYQLLRQSGIFVERGDGHLTDRFTNRVMFPLADDHGRPIGFSGRVLTTVDKTVPKYLNSPETSLFNKRRTLFNFHRARKAGRTTGKIYLFEGFMDVISAFSTGVKSGVASMGTSLTADQVKILDHATPELVVCYDGDQPGQDAINRALDLLRDSASSKLQIRVVQLPAGLDPDEFVQQRGGDQFVKFLAGHEETAVDFRLRFLRNGRNLDNQVEKLAYLRSAVKVLAEIPDQLTRDVYVNQLAKEFNVDAGALESQLQPLLKSKVPEDDGAVVEDDRQLPPPPLDEFAGSDAEPVTAAPAPDQEAPSYLSRTEVAEQTLLHAMLHDPDAWDYVGDVDGFAFVHEKYQALYMMAQGYLSEHKDYSTAGLMDFLDDDDLRDLLGQIEAARVDEHPTTEVIDDCLHEVMQSAPLELKISELNTEIKEAQSLNDEDQVTKLTTELLKLLQQRQKMKTEEEIN